MEYIGGRRERGRNERTSDLETMTREQVAGAFSERLSHRIIPAIHCLLGTVDILRPVRVWERNRRNRICVFAYSELSYEKVLCTRVNQAQEQACVSRPIHCVK